MAGEGKVQKGAAKRWVFTCWCEIAPNYDSETMEALIYQGETAPTTKKDHWQGAVIFNKRLRLKQVKETMDCPSCHFEVAKGTPDEIRKYCTKEDTRREGCEPVIHNWPEGKKSQGKRSDLDKAAAAVKEGKTDREVRILIMNLSFMSY